MKIKEWEPSERPREKLLREGEHRLSNTELLAILLRTGVKGESAFDIARGILKSFKSFRTMSQTEVSQWKSIKGLGIAKIAQIKAAIEIGRRFGEERIEEERPKISSSREVVNMMMPRLRDLKKEVFKVLYLDCQNRIIDISEAAQGTVNQAHPIVREIFQKGLALHAVTLICIHNHHSGNPAPSEEDRRFTNAVKQAGVVLEIKMLDHIIIGDNRYYSFADEGVCVKV